MTKIGADTMAVIVIATPIQSCAVPVFPSAAEVAAPVAQSVNRDRGASLMVARLAHYAMTGRTKSVLSQKNIRLKVGAIR